MVRCNIPYLCIKRADGLAFFLISHTMQKIPQVDLNDFLSEDPKQRIAFVQKVGASFEEIGFIALKGHFLEPQLQTALYSEIKTFFALPEKIKNTSRFFSFVPCVHFPAGAFFHKKNTKK